MLMKIKIIMIITKTIATARTMAMIIGISVLVMK